MVPSSIRTNVDIPYNDRGEFSYSATIPNSQAVYEGGVVQTGQPLYLRMGTELQMHFTYSLDTGRAVLTEGEMHLSATVADANGWTRTIDLGRPSPLRNNGTGAARGTLDVARISEILRALERSTGVVRDHYTVTVAGRAEIRGTVDGGSVDHVFAPSVGFLIDDQELQIDPSGGSAGTSSDPFHPVRGGTVQSRVVVPNRLPVLGRGFEVSDLRVLGIVLGLLAAMTAWALRRQAANGAGRDEPARIQVRYGRWLIQVKSTGVNGSAIEVESMDSLALIAEQHGGVILHERTANGHDYLVEAAGHAYRYRVFDGAKSNGHGVPSVAPYAKG